MTKPRIIGQRPAGSDHRVVTVASDGSQYRRQPCGGCPWRIDQTGEFPPEAFIHSARTAYDMSTHAFGCHESGTDRPVTCAGFLLRAYHNLAVRLRASRGLIDLDGVSDGGHDLYDDYRQMAIANGVDPYDPALRDCR
jgi:hypothetical protein